MLNFDKCNIIDRTFMNSNNVNSMSNENGYCVGSVHVPNSLFYYHYYMAPGCEYYPQGYAMHHDNNVTILLYDKQSNHTHTAVMYDEIDHDGLPRHHDHTDSYDVCDSKECTMSFTNYCSYVNEQWAKVVYIHSQSDDRIRGYYLYAQSNQGGWHTLTPYIGHIDGMLQIVKTVTIHTVAVNNSNCGPEGNNCSSPSIVYDNYCQDGAAYKKYGCSYTDHITDIIDVLIQDTDIDGEGCNTNQLGIDMKISQASDDPYQAISSTKLADHVHRPMDGEWRSDDRTATDFNYQNKKIGFLNLEATDFSFVGPDREPTKIDSIDKLLNIADTIINTGVPNYRMARIPIESGLNIEAWEHYLQDYADKRVLQYIKFGYPLSLEKAHELSNKTVINHYSATQYPSQVQEYLDKEKALGALLGPVNNIEHDHYHCSPLLTRPKDVDKRRVILNLSYPYGQSVNSHVNKEKFDSSTFSLKFPNIDNITQDIIDAKGDVVLFKVDVARAFRNLRVDPADALKLGMHWRDAFYIDLAIAFGWTHGSGSFQLLSDAIAHIVAKRGLKLHCYIDDYIVVTSRSKAEKQFTLLCDLLHELGLPLNKDKLTPPTKRITCLGIDIDVDNNTMSIAQDKVKDIHTECLAVSKKTFLTKQAFQSLLGKLIYIQKCVKPSRVFINRILDLFRTNAHLRKIRLTPDFHKDLQWFIAFLPSFNGISYIKKSKVDDNQSLFLDACLTGMGAVWRDRVYATPIHNCPDLKLTIVHYEMLNIVIALRTWGTFWQHGSISIRCDNLAVVQVVKTGKTRDSFLALCIRNIWFLTATYDIDLIISHIPGTGNKIADTLSRLYSDKPVNSDTLCDLEKNYIWDTIPPHYFDLDPL